MAPITFDYWGPLKAARSQVLTSPCYMFLILGARCWDFSKWKKWVKVSHLTSDWPSAHHLATSSLLARGIHQRTLFIYNDVNHPRWRLTPRCTGTGRSTQQKYTSKPFEKKKKSPFSWENVIEGCLRVITLTYLLLDAALFTFTHPNKGLL